MINNRVRRYLIKFLLGRHVCLDRPKDSLFRSDDLIVYTNQKSEMKQAGIVIYQSNFFSGDCYGFPKSVPTLPLKQWRGIPILFGEPREEWINDGQTLVIYADIIASAFFLISRYEEILFRQTRDEHGRFPAEDSLAVRAGFIDRPVIDEYSEALRSIISERGFGERYGVKLESLTLPFSKINLTHDVDQPYRYRGLRSFARAVWKEHLNPLQAFKLSFLNEDEDEYNTFRSFLRANSELIGELPEDLVQCLVFLKVKSKHILDKPNYSLRSSYMKKILYLCRAYGFSYGLHCSYLSGLFPKRIKEEKEILDRLLNQNIISSRHHFLAQREPEDLYTLFDSGIKHDYSMAYVKRAGFRLGTCRPVRFINPNTRTLSELTMHPLTIMDVTLSRKDCMNLNYEEAEAYAHKLIRQVAHHRGELNLLWHNEQFAPSVHPWQGKLYSSILNLIREIVPKQSSDSSDH